MVIKATVHTKPMVLTDIGDLKFIAHYEQIIDCNFRPSYLQKKGKSFSVFCYEKSTLTLNLLAPTTVGARINP